MVVTQSAGIKSKSAKFDKGENPQFKKAGQAFKRFSDSQRDMFKRVMTDRAEQYKRMDGTEKAHFKTQVIERISRSGDRGGKR